jgi:hypothetical protein
VQAGLPMLAASDCPETWPAGVWKGDRAIPEAAYRALSSQQGAAFRFDYWRVPEASKRIGRPFLGTSFSTYGESTDHFAEVVRDYGAVVPGGVGAPLIPGYPLGLVWRWEALPSSGAMRRARQPATP